jgi:hypothetical protein
MQPYYPTGATHSGRHSRHRWLWAATVCFVAVAASLVSSDPLEPNHALKRVRQALGGQARLQRLRELTASGVVRRVLAGRQFSGPVKIVWGLPSVQHSAPRSPSLSISERLSGVDRTVADEASRELEVGKLLHSALVQFASAPVWGAEAAPDLLDPVEDSSGQLIDVAFVTREGALDRLLVNRSSYLPVQLLLALPDENLAGGQRYVQIRMWDYRETEGLRLPYSLEFLVDDEVVALWQLERIVPR